MTDKGTLWNESEIHKDPLTGRRVRRLTTRGDLNYKAPYHTRTTFSESGEYLVFSTLRDGYAALCRAHTTTGEIVQLIDPFESPTLSLTPGTLAPKTGWLYYWHDRALKGVHITSLEERTLLTDVGREWSGALMSVDPDEKALATALTSTHPDMLAGIPEAKRRHFREAFPDGRGMETRILEISITGREVKELYREKGVKCAHLGYCPKNRDLIYLDRDLPPMWWSGGDYSKTPRCHVLSVPTGTLTPLRPKAEAKFQIHAVWSWDGDLIFYHGPAVLIEGPCPWYIGAVRPDGEIHREWIFDDGRHYGHVAAAPDRPAIILDGNTSPDKLQWLYIDGEKPRFEDIAVHGTEWNTLPGQVTHPHPSTDSQGRYVAFNVARAGRTDVWLVEV